MAFNLYLVLFSVAALGVVAVVLVFFSFDKRVKKQAERFKLKDLVDEDEEEEAGRQFSHSMHEHSEPSVTSDDPGLSALGFNALDVLWHDKQPAAMVEEFQLQAQQFNDQNVSHNPDLVILYVMTSAARPFASYELLQALLTAGLRFGERDIFHRYLVKDEQQKILFSVASAVEPGVFDLANIGGYSCTGLSLFMSISNVDDAAATFETMLDTARQLTDDLAGQLYDETQQPLTEATIAEYRERVQL